MATTKTFTVPDAGEGRTIEHLGCAVDYHVMKEQVTPLEFYRAVGYLSTWNMRFPEVRLYYNARDLEITASYYTEAGDLGYCIVAVFDADSKQFGFHS